MFAALRRKRGIRQGGCPFTDTRMRSYFYLSRVMRKVSRGASRLAEKAQPLGILSSVSM